MHLGVQTLPFEEPLEDTLAFLADLGVESIDWRDDPEKYLDDPDAQAELRSTFEAHDMEISMVGATGPNPLHPVDERAEAADETLRKTIRLADQLDVGLASAFSGLPGGAPGDTAPNWIVAPIPPADQHEHYDYQWEEVAIPYWREINEFADDHDVDVGIEIHTNMLVNSPVTMRRLREAAGDRIGAYVDPGHFWIQGIDPVESIRYLAEDDSIVHVEASDVMFYESNHAIKGRWDMTPLSDRLGRPWSFVPVGYGHDANEWRDIVATLDLVGYDGPVSIQQLNTPHPLYEGIEKGAEFLSGMIF